MPIEDIFKKLPLPKVGQKVKYVKPTKVHWFKNWIENEKLLELGKEYVVKEIQVNSSSTGISLEEFWDENLDTYKKNQIRFTLEAFDWEGKYDE